MSELKEIIGINEFGVCPRCGKLMGMLESIYAMYGLTYNGSYPNKVFHVEREITYACTCGARYPMKYTKYGIVPKGFKFVEDLKDKSLEPNPIGKVDDKES